MGQPTDPRHAFALIGISVLSGSDPGRPLHSQRHERRVSQRAKRSPWGTLCARQKGGEVTQANWCRWCVWACLGCLVSSDLMTGMTRFAG